VTRGIRKVSGIVRLRRFIQTLCLLLFFYLFLQTAYHPINRTGGPVALFFELDPLVLVATWLAGAPVPLALLLSLGTLGVSVLFGRWFCDWICPLGALLGLVGKNPLLRLKKDNEVCNDCRLCEAVCPGGANPDGTSDRSDARKPAECFFAGTVMPFVPSRHSLCSFPCGLVSVSCRAKGRLSCRRI